MTKSRKWRVRGKQGNRPVTTIVTTDAKEDAEEYAKFRARERNSKVPLDIIETTEKKKRKP